MSKCDTDGAEFLIQHGGDRPPCYPGTTEPVITPRLRARLTPVERAIWSGNALDGHLARRVHFLMQGAPEINGWAWEDFVAYGLCEAARAGFVSPSAVSTWVRLEMVRQRKAATRLAPGPSLDDVEASPGLEIEDPGFIPTHLPDEVKAWLDHRVSPQVYLALVLMSEEGYTQSEAAKATGVDPGNLRRSLRRLRTAVEEEND